MGRLAVCALAVMAACGDNSVAMGVGEPLAPSAEVFVVAHQDDDLLFMQPDLLAAVRSGAGVTTVYVTAGDDAQGVAYADRRYDGVRAAYGAGAGSNDWHCGWIDLAGHVAQHCRLDDRNVSLVFLAYPDGGLHGEFPHSLSRLWDGTIAGADTVAERPAHYDRAGLVEAVAAVVQQTQPSAIHTLDLAGTHGRDHPDHMIVGGIALLALADANSHAELISHRSYNIADEPQNKLPAVYDAAFTMLSPYEACTTSCGRCGEACTTIEQAHVDWLERRYAVGFRRAAAGTLRAHGACLGDDLALGPCETATSWRLDDAGGLRADSGNCLEVSDDGELAMAACAGGVHQRFFLDDEGRLWSGVPPRPEANLYYAYLWCLAPTAIGAEVRICGADHAPAWEFAPPTIETPRIALMLQATGRAVQLGDLTGDGKADLCAVEDGLRCAPGDGRGGFGAAVRFDSTDAPLAIDPLSLTLGDVDGDGHVDACGRDANGILCARAAAHFAAERWTPRFGDDVAQPGTSASLAAIDADGDGVADLCGVTTNGVTCVSHAHPNDAIVLSTWPGQGAAVWPAELDGDRRADWCAATGSGVACAVQADTELTTDGAPWGYAIGGVIEGVIEGVPASAGSVAFGDIDGDGRADLCTLQADRVQCARSQGRAFGPRTTLAVLPHPAAGSALWLGDLDGNGRADACVDTGLAIR